MYCKLRLDYRRREEVGSFFEPSIAATVAHITAQIREADVKVAVRIMQTNVAIVTDMVGRRFTSWEASLRVHMSGHS